MKEIIEIRQIANNLTSSENRSVNGYALLFNTLSLDLGGFKEQIDPNALNGVIERSDVYALLNHDKEKGVLARSKNGVGSLKLTIDERGLNYQFDAPQTDLGNVVLEHIKRGEIDSSSFAFTVKEDRWDKQTDGTYIRTILSIDRLFDCSPVYSPAYAETSVECKRFLEVKELDEKEIEQRETVINITITDSSTELTEVTAIDLSTNVVLINDEPEPDEQCDPMPMTGETEQCDLVNEVIDEVIDEDETTDEEDTEIELNGCVDSEKRELELKEKVDIDLSENKNNNTKIKEQRMENYSILKMIKDTVEGRKFDETAQEIINAGQAEMRKSSLGFAGQIQLPMEYRSPIASAVGVGLETIATDKGKLEIPLVSNLLLTKIGAKYFGGLVNNYSIPVYSGSAFNWEDENGDAQDAAGSFREITLSPKRISGELIISKSILMQDSASVEAQLLVDITNELRKKLEESVFGSFAGSTKQPAGIFAGITGTTTPTYSGITATVAGLENANVNEYTWVLNPSAKAKLKATDKTNGSKVMENGEVDGVVAYHSANIKANGYAVGDWSQLAIGQWGGLDIQVDPYTYAKKNQISIVVNGFFDFAQIRPEAIVRGTFA